MFRNQRGYPRSSARGPSGQTTTELTRQLFNATFEDRYDLIKTDGTNYLYGIHTLINTIVAIYRNIP